MRVSSLINNPGPAGWNKILPAPNNPKVLEKNVSSDFLIIGGGFAGLAAAERLSQIQPKARITVVDAIRIGDGPSGRNSGFMIDIPHDLSSSNYSGNLEKDRSEIKKNRTGINFAKKMAKKFNLSSEAFDLNGKINGAATEEGAIHNLEFSKHLSNLGEKYELLGAKEMNDITGSSYYKSGLFTPYTAIIQPALFIREIASGLKKKGVQIFENSPIIDLKKQSNWIARTPKGKIEAPTAILAVNGNLNNFGFMKSRLMHVYTYASMTRKLTNEETKSLLGKKSWAITSADPMGTTVRRISGIGGNRIVIRNRFTFNPSMTVGRKILSKAFQTHDISFRNRFPMLKNIEMEYRWGGQLCLSRNNVQVVKKLADKLFSACCQNGLGTAKGTLAGVCAAELATNKVSKTAKMLENEKKPQLLPPKPIAYIGANAFIKLQEFKAGKEL